MNVPHNTDIPRRPGSSLTAVEGRITRDTRQKQGKYFLSFESVLDQAKVATSSKVYPTPESTTLNRARLQQLVLTIRMRIDDQLFSLISKTRSGRTDHGPYADMMNYYKMDRHPSRTREEDQIQTPVNHPGDSANRYEYIINRAASIYQIDPDLIRAVIRAESDYDAQCTSSKGAMGLMQLMPETAKDLGIRNPYHPAENIMGGTRYLKGLLQRYDGDVTLALASYNWGMGNVERYPGRLPRETQTYIVRIHEYLRETKA
jgi:soluble lytic murein transglycosylase-like protein